MQIVIQNPKNMKNLFLVSLIVTLVYMPMMGKGDNYSVNVTRKESNLYKVTGSDIYIQTRHCYEYEYYTDAILMMNGYTGEIVFEDEEDERTCDVKAVYGRAEIDPGTYEVIISHESDDWFEVIGTDLYIQTSLCLRLDLGAEVILRVYEGGFGRVYFSDDDDYMVDGIYSRMKL